MRSSSRWFISSLVSLALSASAWAGAPAAPTTFPAGFTWGTVLSAHSVEGGHQNDWTAWEAVSGHVKDGSISGATVNHWELYREDQRWMKELGQTAVIVSLEWSRIEPTPKQYDQAAIEQYRAMLKGLRDKGIEPIVVLWDRTLPTWVSAYTGLEVPGVILDFSDYAGQAAKLFGDLVDTWVPVRDPVGAASKAFKQGINPPGKTDLGSFAKALINLLAMHRGAREAILANDTVSAGGKQPCQIGLIASMRFIRPNRPEHPMDGTLAKTAENFSSRAFVDAVMKGDLTISAQPAEGGKGGFGKMQTYSPPPPPNYDKRVADFLVIQYEGLEELRFNVLFPLFTQKMVPAGAVLDGMGQITFAEGLTNVLTSLKKYPVPLMMIVSAAEAKGFDRAEFLRSHAAAALKAIGNGCNLTGFFYDGLLCGFEYEHGYSLNRGLLKVTRQVQERKATLAAKAFARLAKGSALHPPAPEADPQAPAGDDPATEPSAEPAAGTEMIPGGADQPPIPAGQTPEGTSTVPGGADQPPVAAEPGESAAADPSAHDPAAPADVAAPAVSPDASAPSVTSPSAPVEPVATPQVKPAGTSKSATPKGYLKVSDSKKGKTKKKTVKPAAGDTSKAKSGDKKATGSSKTAKPQTEPTPKKATPPAAEPAPTAPDAPDLPTIGDAGRFDL